MMRIYTKENYSTGELNWFTAERKLVVRVLKICRGNRQAASRVLGVRERTVFNKIIQHQIKENEYRN